MVYGYCSVSHPAQNIEAQVNNILREYPDAIIVKEKHTVKKHSCPERSRMLEKLSAGDTVVFDSVVRMSRSMNEALALYAELFRRDITMVFLKERFIDASVYRGLAQGLNDVGQNKVSSEALGSCIRSLAEEQIKLVFEHSESELEKKRKKTSRGMADAAKKGHISGRKAGVKVETKLAKKSKELILKHSKAFGGSLSDPELIKLCGCSRNTYYKYKSMLFQTNPLSNADA